MKRPVVIECFCGEVFTASTWRPAKRLLAAHKEAKHRA